MKHVCISCKRKIEGNRCWLYQFEAVCGGCVKKIQPWYFRRYGLLLKEHRRLQKKDLATPGSVTAFGWSQVAANLAGAWSRVRLELQIDPEFPAGLGNFMKEMGW